MLGIVIVVECGMKPRSRVAFSIYFKDAVQVHPHFTYNVLL